MPLNIKEEPFAILDNPSSFVNMTKDSQALPGSLTNKMPLNIKKELLEQSDCSSLINYMPLNIKKEPNELSDISSTEKMPLNITDEMPENVFLKIEIEENPEPCSYTFSPIAASKNESSENIDVSNDAINSESNATEENISETENTQCHSIPSIKATNVDDHANSYITLINPESIKQTTIVNYGMTNITDGPNSNYIPLSLIIPLQNNSCNLGSTGNNNSVFVTNHQSLSNADPNVFIFSQVSNDNKQVNDGIVKPVVHNETLKLLMPNPSVRFCSASKQFSHDNAGINDEVRTENIEPVLDQTVPFNSKNSTPIINPIYPNRKNSFSNIIITKDGQILGIEGEKNHVICSINEKMDPTINHSIPSISIENFIVNPNLSCIPKEKPIINANTQCIISGGSSATKNISAKDGEVWKITDDEGNVMSGICKKTFEYHKNIISTNYNPILNRHFPVILNEKPIINLNAPHISNDGNSAIKPAFVKTGEIWEIRDGQRNVMRGINKNTLEYFFPKSSCEISTQNKPPNNESLENAGTKNTELFQNNKETHENNTRNCFQTLDGVFNGQGSLLHSHAVPNSNSTFLVENTQETIDVRISDKQGDSINVQNLGKIEAKSFGQFQCKQDKEKPKAKTLLRSSHAVRSRPIVIRGLIKFVNEKNSAKINKSSFEHRKGALVYDRVKPRPTNSLATLLQPLYKYIKDNKCLLCGFESKSTDTYNIRRHLVCHLPSKNFKCNVCDKLFSTPEAVTGHKVNAHPKSKLEIPCKECNLRFSTKNALICHRKKHHKPAKSYTCSICNREFKETSSLKEHYRIHTGEKPYVCAVCGEKFRTSSSLKVHSLKHNKEKLYSCKLCDKSYNRKGLMAEHMNSHNGTSDIKCSTCGKTFNYKSNLAQHMYTHSDKRPHKCETCGLKFKLSHHLRNHLASHHV